MSSKKESWDITWPGKNRVQIAQDGEPLIRLTGSGDMSQDEIVTAAFQRLAAQQDRDVTIGGVTITPSGNVVISTPLASLAAKGN